MKYVTVLALFSLLSLCATEIPAQQQSAEDLLATQREKLLPLQLMDGVWRGNAWTILPDGKKLEMVQTERVGSMLDGAVKVVEGRGYDADGKVVFNAFASLAYNPQKQQISMHSYAQGRVGDFVMKPSKSGYSWEIPAGPATIRYVAEIADGKWFEYGERIIANREPFRFFEMTLSRVGDTKWPSSGSIPMVDEKDEKPVRERVPSDKH